MMCLMPQKNHCRYHAYRYHTPNGATHIMHLRSIYRYHAPNGATHITPTHIIYRYYAPMEHLPIPYYAPMEQRMEQQKTSHKNSILYCFHGSFCCNKCKFAFITR